MNFRGYNESQIFKWLGRPSISWRHFEGNGLIMEYPVEHGVRGWGTKSLIIYFDQDDKVGAIVQRTEF